MQVVERPPLTRYIFECSPDSGSDHQTQLYNPVIQMLINGKADEITLDDLLAVAEKAGIKQSNAKSCDRENRYCG